MEDGWKAGLQTIANGIDEIVKRHLGDWSKVRGIGLGIPGTPDPTFRMLVSPVLAT